MIITSRTQGGKLHLVDSVGKIPLADITVLEDPNEEFLAALSPGHLGRLRGRRHLNRNRTQTADTSSFSVEASLNLKIVIVAGRIAGLFL